MNAHLFDELDRLAETMASGDATRRDARRLSELLRDDPEAQDAYLDCLDVHAMLRWEFRDRDAAEGSSPSPPLPSRDDAPGVATPPTRRTGVIGRIVWIGALAAALALVGAVSVALLSSDADPARPAAGDASGFARLTRSAGDRWSDAEALQTGQRLGAQRIRLQSGIVQITYDSGVVALLAGPADLEMTGPKHAYLHEGRVVLRVPPSAIGYTIETAEANVIDLGTEFGVQANASVGTDVQVYEGEVIAERKPAGVDASPSAHRLQGGQAMRLGTRPGDDAEELNFWPDRFVRYLPDPHDPDAPNDPGKRHVTPYNKTRFDRVHIVPAPADLRIDGSLDDWDLSGQFASRCEPPYESFYHVRGAMMYDRDYLYIGAHVGDPFPMRSTVSPHVKRRLYGNGGCLAFRISTDRDMGWPVRALGRGTDYRREMLPEDYNEKLAFLVLWFYQPEQTPSLHVSYGMDQHGSKVNPPGYRGAYRERDDGYGYTVEYAIPWSLLNAADDPPRAGDVLGCTWLVHWAGPEGRQWKGQLIDVVNPAETDWNFQNAATWGRAIYHAEGDLPPDTVRPLPRPAPEAEDEDE